MNNDKFYVYRFKNRYNKIIYIGRTENIESRMAVHFSEKGHLPIECYDEVNKIEYLELPNKGDMVLIELFLINKLKPKYNSHSVFDGELTINLSFGEYEWNKFSGKDISRKELEYKCDKLELELNLLIKNINANYIAFNGLLSNICNDSISIESARELFNVNFEYYHKGEILKDEI